MANASTFVESVTTQKHPIHARTLIGTSDDPPFSASTLLRSAASTTSTDQSLVFKIVQLADLHISGILGTKCSAVPEGMESSNCNESLTLSFVEDILDAEKPDFVVFTGDNIEIYQRSDRQRAIDSVTQAVEQRSIPYAMVFGNHDDEGDFPREEIVEMLSEKKHSYTERGPESVDGVGNYMLNVKAPLDGVWGKQNESVFRMYFLDSGAEALTDKYPYVFAEYDWIKPSQINYYRALSESEQSNSGGVVLPAVMFFHIPLVEYSFTSDGNCNGEKHDAVHEQGMNLRMLSTLSEMNEVKAVFVGHDHLNEYCCLIDRVQLCYGGGTGFGRAYGSSDFSRRARMIEWSVDNGNHRTIRSWKRHFDEVSVIRDEEILYSEKAT